MMVDFDIEELELLFEALRAMRGHSTVDDLELFSDVVRKLDATKKSIENTQERQILLETRHE